MWVCECILILSLRIIQQNVFSCVCVRVSLSLFLLLSLCFVFISGSHTLNKFFCVNWIFYVLSFINVQPIFLRFLVSNSIEWNYEIKKTSNIATICSQEHSYFIFTSIRPFCWWQYFLVIVKDKKKEKVPSDC